MAEDEHNGNGEEMTEDEKLAAEWEQAMGDAGEGEASGGEDDRGDEWAAAMAEAGGSGEGGASGRGEDVRQAPMQDFTHEPEPGGEQHPDLDVILDIPVTISMEVGNTSIPIRNLLQLNQGSVIELDRLAGEPLDVLVNGMLIAHGEVVMVNEKFGIRLTDVISPSERIRKLSK
ncbi:MULTISPECIES: flagellar motor switch protein FliN [Halomonadaceae]|jgi:flagellar motor switch protein FliN/FliY|uniref:Flagellar motor switch protein FliN n=1 Tax=Vreelandella halophila TaxID=86177 RepID=A0A9X4YBX5_9GAMM|nr:MULTISPECIES: flagellar motor switch protein FliN [Halomonas]MYL27037.1 flagellar motor switch protein FliN [Halomonas utahensis]MYL75839.1 flagellar motor switch protein FliN [Halomonas sp. 22501_18_FS]